MFGDDLKDYLEFGISFLVFGFIFLFGAIKHWEFIVDPPESLYLLYSQSAIKKFFGKIFLLKETYFMGGGFFLIGLYCMFKTFEISFPIKILHVWFSIAGIGVVGSCIFRFRIITFLKGSCKDTWKELGEPHTFWESSDEKRSGFDKFLWSCDYLKLDNKHLNRLVILFFISLQTSLFSIVSALALFIIQDVNRQIYFF